MSKQLSIYFLYFYLFPYIFFFPAFGKTLLPYEFYPVANHRLTAYSFLASPRDTIARKRCYFFVDVSDDE